MNTFQYVSLILLAILLLRDLRKWIKSRTGRGIRLLRCIVWVVAAVSIAEPLLVQEFAYVLGIGRGVDVILYSSVLIFTWALFMLYFRLLRLERQITDLTRHLAIRDAVQAPHSDPAPAIREPAD
jgi:hypothetical protein